VHHDDDDYDCQQEQQAQTHEQASTTGHPPSLLGTSFQAEPLFDGGDQWYIESQYVWMVSAEECASEALGETSGSDRAGLDRG
jgi:hypothetical protein